MASMASSSPPPKDDDEQPLDSIALSSTAGQHHHQARQEEYSSSDENITSKDTDNSSKNHPAGNDNDDVEAGLNGHGQHHQDTSNNNMRGRSKKKKAVYAHWQSPSEPSEDHTNPQYLPPFLLRFFTSVLSLPYINRISTFLQGGPSTSRETSHQPRLWSFRFIDQYIEKPLVRYTKWTRHPLVLWIFLLAWFLGTTFLARAAWWNANVGSNVQWLDGTSTYWQRNDGCGLGGS